MFPSPTLRYQSNAVRLGDSASVRFGDPDDVKVSLLPKWVAEALGEAQATSIVKNLESKGISS